MNWYKKSQLDMNTIERFKSKVETDEENPWGEEDIQQKFDEYYNEQLMERQRKMKQMERPDLYRAPKGEGISPYLKPFENDPPKTKIMNENEIKKQILNDHGDEAGMCKIINKPEFTKHIKEVRIREASQQIDYYSKEYNRVKNIYSRFLKVMPKNPTEEEFKKTKTRQYKNKLNIITNKITYYKVSLQIFTNL